MAVSMVVTKPFSFKAKVAMSSTNYRFVKVSTDSNFCDCAGAGELPIGIRVNSPAINEGVEVLGPGNIAKLTIGSGGCTAGAYLKSGSAGEGIATTTNQHIYGAIALEAGDENDVISVLVNIGTLSHA